MTTSKNSSETPWDWLLSGCLVPPGKEKQMIYKVTSDKPIEQVCDDLQTAITQRQFGVMAVHDLKATMAKKGVNFEQGCHIYEVCNPHQAKKVLMQQMEVSTALPCRISIYEDEKGVTLATIKPSIMLQMFPGEGLAGVAEEVEQVIVASMQDAAGSM